MLTSHATAVLAGLMLISSSVNSYANDLTHNREVLKLMADFAKEMCGEIQSTGSSTSTDLGGKIDVGVSGLIGKLAKLGVGGNANTASQEYKGVVREQLQKDRSNNRECRQNIVLSLQPLLNVGHSPTSASVCVISLESPNDGASVSGREAAVLFRWEDCPEAERYHLYVKLPGWLPIVDDPNLRDAIYRPNKTFGTQKGWIWKVRAKVDGRWQSWSEERSFNTD